MIRPRRRHPRVFTDGWVCPKCGQWGVRHGRGGARGCHSKLPPGPHCEGMECKCEDGVCFGKHPHGYGWRRSPCRNAVCHHCGWSGEVRSRAFERAYGLSRCVRSNTGWHYPTITVLPNTEPGSLVLMFECTLCGRKATATLDPIADIVWQPMGDEPRPPEEKTRPVTSRSDSKG